MNTDTFEKTEQEKIIQAEARGAVEVSFAEEEVENIKQKIEKRKAKQKRLKVVFGGLSLLVVALLLLVSYSQYKLYLLTKAESRIKDGEGVLPKTGEEVVKALSRHILLPKGSPQIAEVQDVARLKETQAFFKDAQNGDVVVVYDTVIFIYRPSQDIVVASGDISGQGQVKP